MELRERLEKQLAQQKDEYERIYKLVTDGKSPMFHLDFARGVIRGIEISLFQEEVHTVFDKEVVNG